MKKNYFVVSDLHGMYEYFLKILEKWNPETAELILLGDYVDRGLKSKEVLMKIYQLKHAFPNDVHILIGNHDLAFLDLIYDTEEAASYYYSWGGDATVVSLLGDYDEEILKKDLEKVVVPLLKDKFQCLIDMLVDDTSLYLIKDNVLFTHAGFQSLFDRFELSKESDFTQIRNHFKFKNQTPYVNVFGHSLTRIVSSTGFDDVWVNDDGKYIGIDGGACFGGQLNAILINGDGEIIEKYMYKDEE